jgi:hypothetical protein
MNEYIFILRKPPSARSRPTGQWIGCRDTKVKTVVPGPVETTIPAEVRHGSPSGEQELLKSIVAGATLGRIG